MYLLFLCFFLFPICLGNVAAEVAAQAVGAAAVSTGSTSSEIIEQMTAASAGAGVTVDVATPDSVAEGTVEPTLTILDANGEDSGAVSFSCTALADSQTRLKSLCRAALAASASKNIMVHQVVANSQDYKASTAIKNIHDTLGKFLK